MEQQLQYSWGRVHQSIPKTVEYPSFSCEASSLRWQKPTLAIGMQRSYGDSCLLQNGHLISTRHMDHLVSFDSKSGIIECEAGLTLGNLLAVSVPRGWFLPVTAGTKFVSIGGAVANDIHGKNHHVQGCFGRHLLNLKVLRSDGSIVECSPDQNVEFFNATIAGLGLTGLILSASIQLIPIQSEWLDQHSTRFHSFDEFLELDRKFESSTYTVSWVDCFSANDRQLRGIFHAGEHHDVALDGVKPHTWKHPRISVPMNFPNFALNHFSMKILNEYYYRTRSKKEPHSSLEHFEPFFYPLDMVGNWNRGYGKRGMHQYQYVIPVNESEAVMETLRVISRSRQGSFLAVLKRFGDVESPGILSFPKAGYTLSLDFANLGKKTEALFQALDSIVRTAGGRLYPAKDGRMSAEMFQEGYPGLEKFLPHVDPKFESDFWTRCKP